MLIENMHEREATRPRAPMTRGNIRMSLAGGCPRAEGYYILGYAPDPDSREFDAIARASMDDGNMHEGAIVAELIHLGFNVWNHGDDQLLTFARGDTLKGLRYSGHPDLFTKILIDKETGEFGTYGIELKAYRTERFEPYLEGAVEISRGKYIINPDMLKKRPWPIAPQVQLYLHSETAKKQGVDGWIAIIKNKNTAELAECFVEKDTEYLQSILTRWAGFWTMMDVKRLPPRFFTDDSTECQYCPFQERCWGVKHPLALIGKKEITLSKKSIEVLDQAVIDRRRGKAAETIGETMLEDARKAWMQEMINYETSELTHNGMTVNVNEITPHKLASDPAKELLEELKNTGVISEETYTGLFTDNPYQEVRFKDRKV